MPGTLSSTQLSQFVASMQNGSLAPVDFYRYMQSQGYQYAGWAEGVATGNELAGIAAIDFLKKSAHDGVGGVPPRDVTDQQIDAIRKDMAIGYAEALRKIAEKTNGVLDRDVNFKETESFHKDAFEKNGLSIDNWTLKIPMDLIRETKGDSVVESVWRDLRETGGTGPDAQAQNLWLTTRIGRLMSSPNQNLANRAKDWMGRVPNTANWNRLADIFSLLGRWMSRPSDISDRRRQVPHTVSDFYNDSRRWQPRRDPLILDLNGNGLETVGINVNNPIMFDHDGDGVKTSSGWIKEGDGFLTLDRNGNNSVDNGTELFGDATPLIGGGKARDGFEALSQEDSNSDGRISSLDNNWNRLRVWRDLNQDGLSQAEELFSLEALGIISIKVGKTENSVFLPNGNEIADLGTYTRLDGSNLTIGEIGKVADINLAEDTFTSHFTDQVPLVNGAESLPEMDGAGLVRSMREAASIDTDAGRTFKNKLASYAQETSFSGQRALLDELVIAWGATGTLAVSNIVNLSNEDARKFNALEQFNGVTIFPQNSNVIIEDGRKSLLEAAWQELSKAVYLALLPQTRLRPLVEQIGIELRGGSINLDFTKVALHFQQTTQVVNADTLGDLVDFNLHVASVLAEPNWIGYELLENIVLNTPRTQALEGVYRSLGICFDRNQITNGAGSVVFFGLNGNDSVTTGNASDLIFAGSGADYLNSGGGDDYLNGGEGNDNLNGGDGNDLLIGGVGDDVLAGGDGDNTYVWGVGAGHDRIEAYNTTIGHVEKLQVPNILNMAQLTFRRTGTDLSIAVVGGSDSLLVKNAFTLEDDCNTKSMINEIVFADGTTMFAPDIQARTLLGTIQNEYLRGFVGDDVINGYEGDDLLEGAAGDDFLIGGLGNDVLKGETGNDLYQFELNWGADTVIDLTGKSIIRFGAGIGRDNLSITLEGDDVTITDPRNNSSIFFTAYSRAGDQAYLNSEIQFDNGDKLTLRDFLITKLTCTNGNDTIRGTSLDDTIVGLRGNDTLVGNIGDDFLQGDAGDDFLDGGEGNDTIFGGSGNDILLGGSGNDTYRFGRNQGSDFVIDRTAGVGVGGEDKIVLDADVLPVNVSLYRTSSVNSTYYNANNVDDLILVIDGSNEQLCIADYFSTTEDMAVESIVFGNGVVWTKADILDKLVNQSGTVSNFTATTGDDTFTVDHSLDQISGERGGHDRIISSASYDLPNNLVADIELSGVLNLSASSWGPGDIIGNSGDNILRKNGLGDFYYDHATLVGGKGNDLYFARGFMNRSGTKYDDIVADKINDNVIEYANEGYDTIVTTAYNATLPANVEKLVVSGEGMYAWYFPTSTYIVNHFNGNELDNMIDASGISSGNPIIDGGLGKDTMIGGGGDDTFIVDNVDDVVIETLLVNRPDSLSAFRGDTIEASVTYNLPANVENLKLTGSNTINGVGNALNNQLDGSKNPGTNQLSGGLGDDTYIVDVNDVVQEMAGEGNDTVAFTKPGNYKLADYQQVENIALEDWAFELNGPNSISGNELDNVVTGNSASNTLIGGAGNDVIYDCSKEGSRKIDSSQYGLVNDQDQLIGGLGNDVLISYSGADTLDGGEGDDNLTGGKGDTTFVFGHSYGHDRLMSDSGDWGASYSGDRILLTSDVHASDVLFSRNGTNLSISLRGSTDVFDVENFFLDATSLELANTIEKIEFYDGSFWNSSTIISRLLSGNANLPTSGNDLIAGSGGDDNIDALEGNDVILGDSGNDTLNGNHGDDSLFGGLGNDTLVGGAGNDVLVGGSGADTYRFSRGFGQDFVEEQGTPSSTEIDSIVFDNSIAPADVRVEFGVGESESAIYLKIKNSDDQIILRSSEGKTDWSTYYVYQNGVERVQFADGTIWTVQNLLDKATANINHAPFVVNGIRDQAGRTGTPFTFTLPSNTFRDIDVGDTLTYSARLSDGAPLPVWLSFDPLTKTFNGTLNGTDPISLKVTVEDSGKLKASSYFSIYLDQDQTVTGTAANDTLRGGIGNDTVYGLAGNDTLYGGFGADTLVGGTGDDYYSIEDETDVIIENANEGDDFVRSNVSFTLSDNVERLALDGGYDLNATGNALNNGLWGNAGDNVLSGGKGNDYLSGGLGNDIYVFSRGDGQDTIDNKDLLTATDVVRFAGNIVDTDVLAFKSGNTLFLKIKGTTDQIGISNYYAANTTLNGEAADYKIDKVEFSNAVTWNQAMIQTMVDRATNNKAPTLATAVPNQTTVVGTAYSFTVPVNTIVDADVGDSVTYSLKMQDGSALPSWLSFNPSTRVLSGTAAAGNVGVLNLTLWGTDNYGLAIGQSLKMTVSAANRTPVLATPLVDQTVALSTAFTYTVPSTSFTDPDVGDVLSYAATLADGSALPSWLSFNASTRTFSGTPSAVGTISLKVTAKDAGNLSASDVFDLVVSVTNLNLTGTSGADTLTGGAGNDTLSGLAGNDKLTGNAGNDVLDGGAGTDTLIGGLGDDTYVVDVATDVVTENLNEGTDTIKSGVTLTLPANVENLILTGATAINGTGNALPNTITGNSAINTLDGGAGADTLIGGAGNDIYVIDNIGDLITENSGEGTDQVNSSVSYTLSANVENLTLTGTTSINGTGNALANILTGNAGNNVLDGGAGADTMVGGAGNDTYVVDNAADVITEAASAGTDLVQSSISYTLGTNLENLTLTGSAAINATGNTVANILVGNSGNNILDGGAGADTMSGGAGNDIYIIDNASDVATENTGEGNDQVKSSVTYTLIANLEALLLTGTTAINGTGNTLDNLLTGNSANNVLNGAAGNDILQGGAGDDTLTDTVGNNIFDGGAGIDVITAGIGNDFIVGGVGNDTITTSTGADVIAFNRGDGMDVVNASTGKDNTLSLGKGIKYADLLFKKSGNDLILVTGTSEQVTMKDWYANVNNHSIANLQVVIEGTTDYNAASTNKLNNKKIEQFNFDGLVTKFDQARAANPSLTSWALSASLLEFYLNSSDTVAMGGDLAYQYAKTGSLSGFTMAPALNLVSNAQFGTVNQTLQPVANLKDATVSLV